MAVSSPSTYPRCHRHSFDALYTRTIGPPCGYMPSPLIRLIRLMSMSAGDGGARHGHTLSPCYAIITTI
eukprot:6861635-Pyramimonas_sp.AAC.1